jgi:hypothetical protein
MHSLALIWRLGLSVRRNLLWMLTNEAALLSTAQIVLGDASRPMQCSLTESAVL